MPLPRTDTLEDARFQDSQFVKGPPYVRFYAGAPLVSLQLMHLLPLEPAAAHSAT